MGSDSYDETEKWSERSPVDHVHGVWYRPSGCEVETSGTDVRYVIDDITTAWERLVSDFKGAIVNDIVATTRRQTVRQDGWYGPEDDGTQDVSETRSDGKGYDATASTLRQRAAMLMEQASAMVTRAELYTRLSTTNFEVGDVITFERRPDGVTHTYTYAAVLCDNGRWYLTGRTTPTSGIKGTAALASWIFAEGYTVTSMHKMKKGDQIL